ncbi:carbohydrate deacetylase [Fusibacter ferrireducens]|uniref:Carbohydrate deacetylase n=1 Tax=Fusibacter ferrireducens TaxID=2785058 RepID=A0ABR9ZYY9_9FIRM|nr:carbohydrate deacetylase [Fusibacter ferrireducens]MBF4695669.1 carbohydrate deacetylase [Fusibacter ferrireducens]
MRLIVNADDFGFTKSITDGILKGHEIGIITSTTAMCNMPYIAYGSALLKDYPQLGVGVHLNVTVGKPVTNCPSLTDDMGNFLDKSLQFSNRLVWEELYREFEAQIERFIDVFGKMPTHLDSHHGAHDRTEGCAKATMSLAKKYELPVRRYNPYVWLTDFNVTTATPEALIEILEKHQNLHHAEMMVHPGYCDEELMQNSSYNTQRELELETLCDSKVLNYVRSNGIILCNYGGE